MTNRRPPRLILRKFMAKVDKTDSCWNWTGETNQRYGNYGGWRAHRRSYEHFVGPIPDGMDLDHLCRNTLCVRPDHLEPVSPAENLRRVVEARTHCKNGHAYTVANTGYRPSGSRVCRRCVVDRHRRYIQRKRADG